MRPAIGILGGMTPESTGMYYETIIHEYQTRFDDYNFPQILIWSVSFQQFEDWMKAENWEAIADELCSCAKKLENAGADCIIIATNTMHHVYDALKNSVRIPILHIADAAAEAMNRKIIKKAGLLGTIFTMNKSFYKERLKAFSIDTIVPDDKSKREINRIIFEELGRGIIKPASKQFYLDTCMELVKNGAEGIILGCTEIPLLVQEGDLPVPVFDTARIHARAALKWALDFV